MFHSSLSNLHNNVIIYNIKKSSENSFVCERNVQNFAIHVIRALYIDVSLYLTLTIQASSRLKRSANHLWNNSDVCRKKFGEWYPLKPINICSQCKVCVDKINSIKKLQKCYNSCTIENVKTCWIHKQYAYRLWSF